MVLRFLRRAAALIGTCVVLLGASGCGDKTSAPSPLAPDAPPPVVPAVLLFPTVRLWTGTIEITACEGNVYICRSPAPVPFMLRLKSNSSAPADGSVVGAFYLSHEVSGSFTDADVTGGPVPGVAALVLKGAEPGLTSRLRDEYELRLLTYDGALTGIAHYATYDQTRIQTVREGRIVKSREVDVDRSIQSGVWFGRESVVTCDAVPCHGRGSFQLPLAVAGSSVSVRAPYDLSYSGTVTGETISMRGGYRVVPPCQPRSYSTVYCKDARLLEGTLDDLGRLKGLHTVDSDYYPEGGSRRTEKVVYSFVLSRWVE